MLQIEGGKTSAPNPLTEADLISKMDSQGIGTDATIHEHIKTVQDRGYATKRGIYVVPEQVGIGLIQSFKTIGIDLYKPYLRAQMEKEMKLIAVGQNKSENTKRDCL